MFAITLDPPLDAADEKFGTFVAMDRSGQSFIVSGGTLRRYIFTQRASPIMGAPPDWVRADLDLQAGQVSPVAIDGDMAVAGQSHYQRATDGTWSVSRVEFDNNGAVAISDGFVAISNAQDFSAPFFSFMTWAEADSTAQRSTIQPPFPSMKAPARPTALAMRSGLVVAGCPSSGPLTAPLANGHTGIVFVLKPSVQGANWEFLPIAPGRFDSIGRFGSAVDLDDDAIIIGQPGGLNKAGFPTGNVHIVPRSDPSAVTVISPPSTATEFGRAVALKGRFAVVGGISDGVGAIWWLKKGLDGWELVSDAYTPLDDPNDTAFGSSLGLCDEDPDTGMQLVCVGAPGNPARVGAVYLGSPPVERSSEEIVDPMSIILSASNYRIWTERHGPRPPSVAEVANTLRSMDPAERQATLARLERLGQYVRVFERAAVILAGS